MTPRTRQFASTASALAFALLASPALADSPGFTSPSGNITCYLADLTRVDESPLNLPDRPFVCLIFDAQWTPSVGDEFCDLDRSHTIVLAPDGPARDRWTCAGDIFWPINGKISYGTTWEMFDYTCQMATSGVSCQNANGNGFSVNRAGRTLY